MRVFATVLFLGAFLVLIGIPGKILARSELLQAAGPHEVWQSCGIWCENTCEHPQYAKVYGCIPMCKHGYFCADGYIRETSNGRCILQSECPTGE